MNPYLRQAIVRYHNEFFAMSEEEQTRFKLEDHEELDDKISDFIKKKMGNTDKLGGADLFEFNQIILPWRGIGPNNFMMNEFDWDDRILDFANLYDYNEHNHIFQETSNVEDFAEYTSKALFNRFNGWARANIDDEFYYLNIFSYQIWIYYALDEYSFEWFDKNIPHEYVSGPNDGDEVEGGWLWDLELDAKGNEGYYEHMSEFARKWSNGVYDNLDNNAWNGVFILPNEKDDPLDPCKDYIFGSMDILKEITYYNFIEDCKNVQLEPPKLLALKADSLKAFEEALDAEFAEIQKRPSSEFEKVKEKGMDVVVAPGAFDGLDIEE